MNFQKFKLDLEKAEEPEIKLPTSAVWLTLNCGKFWKRWEYQTTWPASWETCMQVKKQQLKPDMEQWKYSKLAKICQGCILSPCLFKLYAKYIMQNARLDETQAGIKIAGKNINNLRYADDTTLMEESKEEIRASWWKWKRREKKVGLKLNTQKTKIMASGPITSWEIDGETGKIDRLYILGLQYDCRWRLQPWN